ncbi:hypothetical protein EK904_000457 [Melospiza melodia maxima]|nr:hypothetical protein EK904_000457 [Melospiza melodia maxima]
MPRESSQNPKEMDFPGCASVRRANRSAIRLREMEFNRSSNLDDTTLLLLLEEWSLTPSGTNTKMFLISPVVCLVAGVLIIPTILFVIFSRFKIRQETRYMLLGNALLSDLIYLLFYTLSAALNAAHLHLPKEACVLLLFLLAVAYCGGLFTAVAIVLDTYIAVLFPLRYVAILPPSRTKRVLTGILVSLTVCNVLMILPKVLFPFLYGLRYREISASLKSIVRRKQLHPVSPAPPPS